MIEYHHTATHNEWDLSNGTVLITTKNINYLPSGGKHTNIS